MKKTLTLVVLLLIPAVAFAWGLLPLYPNSQDINMLNIQENMRRFEAMMKNVPDALFKRNFNNGASSRAYTISGVTTASTCEATIKTAHAGDNACIKSVTPSANTVTVALSAALSTTVEIIISVKY